MHPTKRNPFIRQFNFDLDEVNDMSGKNQWVVRNGDKWGVRGEGNDRLTSVHDTQQEAFERARDIARNQGSEVLIQGEDGKSAGSRPNLLLVSPEYRGIGMDIARALPRTDRSVDVAAPDW